MKRLLSLAVAAAAAALVDGCVKPPPGAEHGPKGTIAYTVLVEATPPGAKIEANGRIAGDAPIRLKFFGDLNGKFHDFGFPYYIVRALPVATNQYVQTRVFHTGYGFTKKDVIPNHIMFDMNQPNQVEVPGPGAPVYYYPYGPPSPYYYYPPYGPYGPYWRYW